jgi:multidrug resistance efflux pump
MAAVAAVAAACVVPVTDRAGGPFKLRALRHAELRAPVAGFLRETRYAEGHRVPQGALVARVEVPDLESRIAQKDAELAEAAAKVSVLRAAPAPAGSAGADDDDGRAQAFQIAAGEAQVRRMREELNYLNDLRRRQRVESPVDGVLITPRLAEKMGQYFREGELICEVEEPAVLEAEVAVPEQDMARVRPGLAVELKARVAPFDTLRAEVTRVAAGARSAVAPAGVGAGAAPAADTGELPGRVIVYCTVSDAAAAAGARPGMTGYARIHCGSEPAARVYGRKLLQYVRTEFWW